MNNRLNFLESRDDLDAVEEVVEESCQISCRSVPSYNNAKRSYESFRDALSGNRLLPTKGRQYLALVDAYAYHEVILIADEPEHVTAEGAEWPHQLDLIDSHAINTLIKISKVEARIRQHGSEYAKPHNYSMKRNNDPQLEWHLKDTPQEIAHDDSHETQKVIWGFPGKPDALNLLKIVLAAKKSQSEQLRELKKVRAFVENEIRQLRAKSAKKLQAPKVLEELEGFVDQIEDGMAFVTLTSKTGQELIGEYKADELLALGIQEGRRFKCRTICIANCVTVEFEAIPDINISAAEEANIQQEIRELTSGGIFDGDY